MTDNQPTAAPSLFSIIGYEGEVSEPDGPAVRGYFLDRWAQEAQANFTEWLAKHDADLTAERDAWRRVARGWEQLNGEYRRHHWPTPQLIDRAKKAEAELADLRGRIAALADEWDVTGDEDMRFRFVDRLRALLDPAPHEGSETDG